MSESSGATTQEMRGVRDQIVAVTGALNDFRQEVQGALTRLTDAITSLARLEERGAAQHADLTRALRWIENHEGRINKLEVESSRTDERGLANTDFRRNIERVGIALVSGGAMLVLPKLFELVAG